MPMAIAGLVLVGLLAGAAFFFLGPKDPGDHPPRDRAAGHRRRLRWRGRARLVEPLRDHRRRGEHAAPHRGSESPASSRGTSRSPSGRGRRSCCRRSRSESRESRCASFRGRHVHVRTGRRDRLPRSRSRASSRRADARHVHGRALGRPVDGRDDLDGVRTVARSRSPCPPARRPSRSPRPLRQADPRANDRLAQAVAATDRLNQNEASARPRAHAGVVADGRHTGAHADGHDDPDGPRPIRRRWLSRHRPSR
jgi:hypothetical protein